MKAPSEMSIAEIKTVLAAMPEYIQDLKDQLIIKKDNHKKNITKKLHKINAGAAGKVS